MRNANWASLLFSTTPISGAFSRWPMRIYVLALGFALLFVVFGPDGKFGLMLSRNSFTGTHFRLSVWKLREADASALDPAGLGTNWGVGALGLMRDGCALNARGVQEARGAHLYLSFDEQVTANGFSFRTLPRAHSQILDAVGFDLAYCHNDREIPVLLPLQCPEDKWRVVGSSDCRFGISMTCYPVPNWIFKTALSRDYVHSFDLSGPWYHGLCTVLWRLIPGVGNIAACTWSVLGKLHRARVHFGLISFVLNGVVLVLLGCAHLFNGPHPAVGWLPLIIGFMFIYLGSIIVWQVSKYECKCIYIYIHTYIYIYIHIYMNIYIYTHTNIYIFTYAYIYIYLYMHICMYTCMCIYIHTYV